MKNQVVSERLRSIAARQCPVTSGAAVKMSLAGFKRACAARIEEGKAPRCKECKGKSLPEELTVIEINSFMKKGEEMARKRSACEFCGETKMVKAIYEKDTCTMCENVRSRARTRPDVVLAALKELAPESLAAPAILDDRKLADRIAELEAANAKLLKDNKALETQNESLWKAAEDAQKAETCVAVPINKDMQDLALRLAIAILRDKAAGFVTIDDVEMLRNC